ncbi:MBL fold metallo-hydrolase [Candidatus Bathyarchaeota archaeon]|nr:MBL fold metallo-hydrolase [Candidatus Bathyarchaeota archaeon]
MTEEIVPDLYRTEIPLPKSPLKWLNSYIVKGRDRCLIIDTGFNREECRNEMNANLQKLGVDLNKTDIYVTHLHVDHIGLAGTLATEDSRVYFNEIEARQVSMMRSDWTGHWQKLLDVYVANGFPADSLRLSMESHPAVRYGLKRDVDFSVVRDGDAVEVGDFHFQCLSTPGHSPGHMCLYEPNRKILVSGDHILFDITPNINYWLEMDDPLNDYLTSLERVKALDVRVVLPGHRRLMHNLHERIKQLQEHHRDRLNEVLTALKGGAKSAFQTAPYITWDINAKSWEEFPPAQKWFAFGETLAHLRFLENKGEITSQVQDGRVLYSLA